MGLDPEGLKQLHEEYEFHVALVEDLMFELTRAGNFVLDKIRDNIARNYGLRKSALLVESGPFMDLTYHTYRVEYRGEERTLIPYPILHGFKK